MLDEESFTSAQNCGSHAADAAAVAHLPYDGRLGQRSRSCGSGFEHIACIHRAGNLGDPTRTQTPTARLRWLTRAVQQNS